MDGQIYREFFLRPTGTRHRRYEALRSVFVERQSLSEVGDRFAVSYGTIRNWISQFRREYDCGQTPPFSRSPRAGVLAAEARRRMGRRSRSPMSKRCR
jgi:transposase